MTTAPATDIATITAMLAAGQAEAALHTLAEALAIKPNDASLCNLLGLAAIELERPDQAEAAWQQALQLNPDFAEPHFNLGVLYHRDGRHADAQAHYGEALRLQPDSLAVRQNLANLLAATDRLDDAEALYREILRLMPEHADSHFNLALLLRQRGQDDAALAAFREAAWLDPASPEAPCWVGLLLAERREWDAAQAHYLHSLGIDPAYVDAWCNFGLLLADRQQWAEAEQCLRHALTLAPDRAKLHANLGSVLLDRGDVTGAEAAIRQAIALAPNSAQAWSNLAVLLSNDGREGEAETCFRRAIALSPEAPLARFNFAQQLLIQGRFDEGWALYEARFDPTLHVGQRTFAPRLPMPRWQGESLVGKALLVWMEQGFGDEIQFCRYLPLLKAQGAGHITLVCHPPLKALLATLPGVDAVLAVDDDESEVRPHDYWTFLLSLPYQFRTELATIPARIPYLQVPAAARQRWAGRLADAPINVGIVWKGNPRHLSDHERSLPDMATLAPLWDVPGIRFVSLQKGRDETTALAGLPHLSVGPALNDFADTAAVISQLDLLISVDTAVVHLAGALGKPCWVMLPAYKTDWRWLRDRADSPWYPGVMRLFRQAKRGDWTLTVLEVRDSLMQWLASR
jgi:tetratricopeptide (TPR) repeat protein